MGVQLAFGEFGRGNRIAVVLDDDAAREKVLRDEEFLERARQLSRHLLAIRDDTTATHRENPKAEIREVIAKPQNCREKAQNAQEWSFWLGPLRLLRL